MSKKVRADSILGTLPAERQDEIADHARTHTLAETQAWLAADGIRIGLNAISEWLHSWRLRQGFKVAGSSAMEFRDWLAKDFPDFSEAELDARAALMFQAEAMKAGDAETYLAFASARSKAQIEQAKLKLRAESLQLEKDKFYNFAAEQMLSKAIREKADELNALNLSQAEKIRLMRKAAFSDVDALEASGEVKIPKA